MILFLVLLLAFFYFLQISDINANLVILMLKFDKLDKNYNFLQRSYDKFQSSMSTRNLKKFSKQDFSSHTLQLAENHPKDDSRNLNLQEENIQRILSSTNDFRNETVVPENKEKRISQSFNNESQKSKRRKETSRIRRSILMFEKRNLTDVDSWLESDESDDDDLESNEYRTARARRDDGRGKKEKKKKSKRRPKRSRRRLGIHLSCFILLSIKIFKRLFKIRS